MVAQAFNPSTWETEAGGLFDFDATLATLVPPKSKLQCEILDPPKKRRVAGGGIKMSFGQLWHNNMPQPTEER